MPQKVWLKTGGITIDNIKKIHGTIDEFSKTFE